MVAPEQEVARLQQEYRTDVPAFLEYLPRVLGNQLEEREILHVRALWDRIEKNDASARQHFSVPLRYNRQTFFDLFEDHHQHIQLCLNNFSKFTHQEEPDDVTDVEETGLCMDAGPADDWKGK